MTQTEASRTGRFFFRGSFGADGPSAGTFAGQSRWFWKEAEPDDEEGHVYPEAGNPAQEMGAEIERLTPKTGRREADLRLSYCTGIEESRQHQREARDKLDELRVSGEDAREDLKSDADKA